MRRVHGFIIIFMVVPLVIGACGASPKSQANKFAERMPEEIGAFELEVDDRIELTAESIGSTGHITLHYTSSSGEVYVVIDVYGTEAAAEVAVEGRYRDLRLLGYVFDTNRSPRALNAEIADLPQGRVAIFERDEAIIEVQYLKEAREDDLDEASWELFLENIREIDANLG
jgi:hypothetical protein